MTEILTRESRGSWHTWVKAIIKRLAPTKKLGWKNLIQLGC